jgi:hypothetical protein
MDQTTTSRRSFLKSSALVAAPVAAVTVPAAAFAADDSAARLARLEDERAIEAVHRAFLKSGGQPLRGKTRKRETIARIDPDSEAEPEPVEFSDDGQRAVARRKCTLQLARHFEGDTTVERMARFQGEAVAVRSKRCVILAHYEKTGGQWALASAEMA